MSLLLKVRVMEMSLVIVRFAVGKSCTGEDECYFNGMLLGMSLWIQALDKGDVTCTCLMAWDSIHCSWFISYRI